MDASVVNPPSGVSQKSYTFGLLWIGQLVSIVGSTLTRFALGVYVLQETGSNTQYALISFFALLPAVLLLPLAGTLVDRWDRRMTIIVSDLLAGMSTLTAWLLLSAGLLEIWHIYLLVSFNAACGAFQGPAFAASVPLLVSKKHLGRAAGMVKLGPAVARLVVPAVAGVLMVAINLTGIILIDLTTFVFATITVLIVTIPRPEASEVGKKSRGKLWQEAAAGWAYIQTRPGLFGLLLFFAATNLSLGMVWLLIIPLVLSFTDAAGLGTVLSLAGSGMLLGGIAMSVWGGPKQRVLGVLGFTLLQGLVLFLAGLQPNAVLVVVAAFIFLFSYQIATGTERVIWQSKVPSDMLGRVHAIHEMIAWGSTALAFLLSGPLTDYLFEPWLAEGGALAGSVGLLVGVGPGRGIAFLFLILAVLTTIATVIAYLNPRIRNVETELPDMVKDDAARGTATARTA